ncbi:amidohydrolase family protein [Cohnella caldifontis]|uniref:amidohydrolase family protein n=1 Tax=Cohnella caldifontis TaxID=3027471 RepID=UPI0023EBE1A8|nr:amidohydrolase family protein [Cohnella sp. YIM B05605]
MKKARYGYVKLAAVSMAVLASSAFAAGCLQNSPREPRPAVEPAVAPIAEQAPVPAESTPPPEKTIQDWVKTYGELPLADAHNHGSVLGITHNLALWKTAGADRVVLFGEVSKPISVVHDEYTWTSYLDHPDLIVPFFSGINLKDPHDLQTARERLEKGYFGIGEIAAASSYSPAVSDAEWKADHPMDGILPELYALCAEYEAPLLLHIDPPMGFPIDELERALETYPDTRFIFAHANAYNSPENVERLLEAHPNLYADLFAGFTAFNPDSANKLEDFADVIRRFPDRFMVSTDSGYDLAEGEEQAIEAMYKLLDLLKDDPELVRKAAYDNLDALIRDQPATRTQKKRISEWDRKTGNRHDTASMTKLEAGRILAEADDSIE